MEGSRGINSGWSGGSYQSTDYLIPMSNNPNSISMQGVSRAINSGWPSSEGQLAINRNFQCEMPQTQKQCEVADQIQDGNVQGNAAI